jgi:hypothetical protein
VVAESTVVYASERGGEFNDADRARIEAVVARMESEMKAAAKQLEFERAAALRDEIQQIRLRVLQEDASITVGRAAERAGRAARHSSGGLTDAADRARGRRGAAAELAAGPAMEVTEVTILPADEEPADNLDGVPGEPGIDEGTIADWLPGIRDEHDDEAGWQARWLDRPTWDRTVTPNIRRRTGQRPARRR